MKNMIKLIGFGLLLTHLAAWSVGPAVFKNKDEAAQVIIDVSDKVFYLSDNNANILNTSLHLNSQAWQAVMNRVKAFIAKNGSVTIQAAYNKLAKENEHLIGVIDGIRKDGKAPYMYITGTFAQDHETLINDTLYNTELAQVRNLLNRSLFSSDKKAALYVLDRLAEQLRQLVKKIATNFAAL